MTRILSFDPASACGWSVLDNGEYTAGGTQKFTHPTKAKIKKGGKLGHRGKKWGDYGLWVREIIAEYSPDIIVYERVRRNVSTLAAHSYGYFRYMIEAEGYITETPIYPFDVGSWKALITDDGSSNKQKVDEYISKVFPDVIFESDDHSDALSIGYSAWLLYDKDIDLLDKLWENNTKAKKKDKAEKK